MPSWAASATDQTSPPPARQTPWTATPVRRAGSAARAPEGGDLAGGEPGAHHLEPGVVDLLLGLQGLEQPVAQHPELEAVEERVHLVAVPRAAHQVGRRDRQGQVDHEPVEVTVADHVAEVGPQALARLALDLVGG